MDVPLGELSASGIFVLLVLKFTSDMIKAMRNGKSESAQAYPRCIQSLGQMQGEVHELREWHKPNENGRQTWKDPDTGLNLKVLNDSVKDLVSETSNLTVEMKDFRQEMRDQRVGE